jgi:small ligand-binding sensory domain FIST
MAPWRVDADTLSDEDAGADVWRARVGVAADADPHFIVLADPLSCDAGLLIAGLDAAYAGGRKIGGLASGGARSSANALFLGHEVFRDGAVGVALSGNIAVDTIVAQGCRPIGVPMPITRCERNVLLEVGGRAPIEVLRELYDTLDEHDRELFRHSLFVGLEMREDVVEHRDGDLLVRNIVGMDPQGGSVSIGALPRQWQVVQFLLRDANTATGDLSRLLDQYARTTGARPSGALLFSCLGRGVHLFGTPDHDTELFRQRLGPIPLGGFFCNGEIGPVGGATFLHGYTSSFGLFREKAS